MQIILLGDLISNSESTSEENATIKQWKDVLEMQLPYSRILEYRPWDQILEKRDGFNVDHNPSFILFPLNSNIILISPGLISSSLGMRVQSQEESKLADSCESGHAIDFLVTLDEDL
ncbi:hypothetical protein F0562_030147 [Nyssa sinensis]|uniref:Uncharacterized protein n=1 Tax=Nyssa sinensis TaxID=561372 RepID=A0A5J5AXM7_9ASTE|nr:hypothetical protein F0562_030147 [Nyssa sinensis]